MPAKRTRSVSRKRWGKRRRYTPMTWRRSLIGKMTPIVHKFKRTYQLFNEDYTTGGCFGYDFKFSSLPNKDEFQTLFDSYKITRVVLRFYNGYDGNDIGNTSFVQGGWLHYCVDYNDGNPAADFDAMKQYSSYSCVPLTKCQPYVRSLRPKISMQVYKTAIATAYAQPDYNPWCDLTDTGIAIPFFGIKVGIEGPGGATDRYLRCEATVYFMCKTVK